MPKNPIDQLEQSLIQLLNRRLAADPRAFVTTDDIHRLVKGRKAYRENAPMTAMAYANVFRRNGWQRVGEIPSSRPAARRRPIGAYRFTGTK